MATIGTFKKTGSEYVGEIVTLSVQAKAVRIVPEDSTPNDNAPSHRVFVGRAEIGAAWSKRSTEGRDCPSSDDLEHAGRMTSGGSGSLLLKSMPLSDDAASGAFRWSVL
jgi:hypothetical protein